jgi:hemoglobin
MVAHHLNKHLTEQQRRQWLKLLLEAADEVNIPDDPEFRSALVAYLEWGSRIAVLNSKENINPVESNEPMPEWGWGVPGKPFMP